MESVHSHNRNRVILVAGGHHNVGLKADGTVVAVVTLGSNGDGKCNVTGWNLMK